MARIRTIKPEFFRHRRLYIAEKETKLPLRVAFSGLWTVADREGRFRWEPEEIKLDCLPYDNVDFSRVLDALATRGFVVKYASGGRVYGWIPGFSEHQVINNREAESKLPEPPKDTGNKDLTREPRVDDASPTPLVHAQAEGKGKEGKGTRVDDAPPAGLNSLAWEKWFNYRKEIRKPLKPASIPAAQRQLAAFGSEQSAVVERSIANGWQGLFPLKDTPQKPKRDDAMRNVL